MKTFKQFSGAVQGMNLNEAKMKKDDYFASFIMRQTEEFCNNVISLMGEAGYPTIRIYPWRSPYDRDTSIYFKVTLPFGGVETNPEDNVGNVAPESSTNIRFSGSRETVYCNLLDGGSQSIGMLVKKLDKIMRTKQK